MDVPLSNILANIALPYAQYWFIVGICILMCAFFSGMEIAFLSANKLRIELRSKQGDFSAKILSGYLKKPSEFISTVLVANNFALVIYGIYMNNILFPFFEGFFQSKFIIFIVSTIISTLIVLITAEFIPKSLFRINSDSLLFALILPFRFFHILLWPIIFMVKKVSSFLLRIFTKTKITEDTPVFTKVDLDNYIASLEKSGQNLNTEINTEVFRNALEFREVKVRDFMVPRTELIALREDCNMDEIKELFIKTSLSKILIYRENIDNIVGFVHHSEMYSNPSQLSQILKPVLITNESVSAHSILKEFIQKRRSIAVVLDEFGGTSGIITIEDVIEEIFGEIEDEFDVEKLTEQKIKEDHYLFSTRHEIYYLNDKYDLKIPEGDYTTLGGFIMNIAEKIPRNREIVRYENLEFVITKSKGARLEETELFILPNES